jgi:hypothetical protein
VRILHVRTTVFDPILQRGAQVRVEDADVTLTLVFSFQRCAGLGPVFDRDVLFLRVPVPHIQRSC